MKKNTAYFIMTLLLALTLCGCGNDRTDATQTPSATATVSASPSLSPSISPDMEDGEVEDTDGIIGDEDTAGGTTGGDKAKASASPSTDVKK